MDTRDKEVLNMQLTLFKWCRQFYNMYPQIGATASHQFGILIDSQKGATVSHQFITNPERLVKQLSFSHIREIMILDDEFERFFYETECIKCGWTVRELRRQIKTNLYFRSGVSKNPRELLKPSEDNPEGYALSIKDSFTFEFLGIEASGSLNESDLEQALIDHLQEFMLELGEGRGEYIAIAVDEYLSTDLYFQLHSDVLTEGSGYDTPHEFVGKIVYDADDEKRIMELAENWRDTYQDLYYINTNSDGLSRENTSPYFIKMEEPGARKLWWLFSIPLLFAGSAMFILEGKPSKNKK